MVAMRIFICISQTCQGDCCSSFTCLQQDHGRVCFRPADAEETF